MICATIAAPKKVFVKVSIAMIAILNCQIFDAFNINMIIFALIIATVLIASNTVLDDTMDGHLLCFTALENCWLL